MNRKMILLFCVTLLMIFPSQVVANNQGFVWGIEVEHSLEVSLKYLSITEFEDNESLNFRNYLPEHLFVNITELPEIPDDIDSLPYLSTLPGVYPPRPGIIVTRANNTAIPPGWQILWDSIILLSHVVMPTGNWVVLAGIVNDYIQSHSDMQGMEVVLIDTSTRWGWKRTYSWVDHFATEEREYFKVDGTLAMYHMNNTQWADLPDIGPWRDTEDVLIERLDGPFEGLQFPILEIALGLGVVSLVVIVVLIKYRHRLQLR